MLNVVPDFLFPVISQKVQSCIDEGGTIQDAFAAIYDYNLSDELMEYFVDYAVTANKMSRLTEEEFCQIGEKYCKLKQMHGLCEKCSDG